MTQVAIQKLEDLNVKLKVVMTNKMDLGREMKTEILQEGGDIPMIEIIDKLYVTEMTEISMIDIQEIKVDTPGILL